MTGPAGIAADLDQVADEAGQTLLIATLSLVLILLLVVYRAPLLALLPLLAVGAAYLVAIGIAYLLIKAGSIIGQHRGHLPAPGARLRRRHRLLAAARPPLPRGAAARRPAEEALPTALRESVPAIAASGGTVIAAMLVLLVADLQSTHWLGPILAIGIAVMLASAFTLLPALLAVLGERAFWPARGRRRGATGQQPLGRAGRRSWSRRRSRPIIVLVSGGLLVLALGNLSHHGTIGFGQGETRPTNSSRGTTVLNEHFPPGIGSPLTAVVAAERGGAGRRRDEGPRLGPAGAPGAADRDAEETVVVVILARQPLLGRGRRRGRGDPRTPARARPGGLLGGIPAENYDIEQTNARDTQLIVPLVLLVVGLILAAVLRALVAPAFLIAPSSPPSRRRSASAPSPSRSSATKGSPSTSSCSPSSSWSRSGSTTTSS